MKLKTLTDLLLDQLQDLYSAENQMIKALPKMAKAASDDRLQNAFRQHLDTTKRQKQRLEQVFAELNQKPKAKKCKGMEGLIEEGEEMIKEKAEPAVRDVGLIAAAQRVEHYEIAGYGTACALAKQLGLSKAAELLHQTSSEEGETDHHLTDLAVSQVNIEAQEEPVSQSSSWGGRRGNGGSKSRGRKSR